MMSTHTFRDLYGTPEHCVRPFIGLRSNGSDFMVYGVDQDDEVISITMPIGYASMGVMRLVAMMLRKVLGEDAVTELELRHVNRIIEETLLGTKREREDV